MKTFCKGHRIPLNIPEKNTYSQAPEVSLDLLYHTPLQLFVQPQVPVFTTGILLH